MDNFNLGNLKLSMAEREAVIAALPLMMYADYDTTPLQKELNLNLSFSVSEKMLQPTAVLTPNELRILCLCVSLAKSFLAGDDEFFIPSELRAELSRHYFAYCALYPRTEKLSHRLDFRFSGG